MAGEGSKQNNTNENTSTRFDILFRGEIAENNSLDQVKARVAESFKLDEAAINKLFSGVVVSLKRNIDRATAERISMRLLEAGAVTKVVPSDTDPSTANQSPLNQTDDKAFTLAPLGSDVSERADKPEQERGTIPLDHLGLEPVGSNIIEEGEAETIEPLVVDTSHLSLE